MSDVQKSIRTVFDLMCELYPGYYQRQSCEAIFVGLLTGKPILLVGTHASWKSSKIMLIGKLFDKPVSVYRGELDDVEKVFDLAAALKVDGELLMKNLLPHINVQYTQYSDRVHATVTVDSLFYPKADVDGWRRVDCRVPLTVFTKQLYPEIEAEDLLGYAIDHPALLGKKPPHAIKESRLSGADVIFIDEFFKGPKVTSALHMAMNEKIVETSVGPIRLDYLFFAAATNPLTSAYGSNVPALYDIATMDRFIVSSYEVPPSVGEINLAREVWKRFDEQRMEKIPVELLYSARREFASGNVPSEAIGFMAGLLAALSKCYFSPRQGQMASAASDPFSIEKECSVCVYDGSTCSYGSISKTRPFLAFEDAVKIRGYLYGRSPSTADVYYVLPMILQHRIKFSDKLTGNMFQNTLKIVREYSAVMSKSDKILASVFEALKNRDFKTLLQIRNSVTDRTELKSLLDEFIEQRTTVFRAEGSPDKEDSLLGQDFYKMFCESISCFKAS
ncbi:MAG: hypothetical protein QXJ62_03890 [Nitrososphaeria archaeon]